MTLSTRLILTVAGIAILLVSPSIYAIGKLAELNRIATEQRMQHGAAYQALGGLQTRLAELDKAARSYTALGGDSQRVAMWAMVDSARMRLDHLANAGYASAAERTATQFATIERGVARIDSLMAAGDRQEAASGLEDVKNLIAGSYDASLAELGREIDERSSAGLDEALAIAETARTTAIGAVILCGALALALGLWTTQTMTRPIIRLEDSVARVASGSFRVPDNLPHDRRDEIGSLARSFRSMTHRLAELDRMKAEFMSIATHELKTPINVISGYAELMEERVYGDVNDRQTEALRAMRDQIRSLGLLVNQLLDISRLEAGGLRLQILDVVVSDFFGRITRSFGPLAQKKQIAFAVEPEPNLPATFPGDADRLRDQVLGNLISNALKFTPEGGAVTVRARTDGSDVIIEVQDTGPGIPADKLPFIFDKFFQVGEQARSRGAGLGLAIAHEIVDAHGGHIRAVSEPGAGTTFTIELPLGAAPRPEAVATT